MRKLQLILSLVSLMAGCVTIRPQGVPDRAGPVPREFSHDAFGRVLQRVVDDDGRVDYAALKARPEDLERYYLLLTAYSPDSHPVLFPTEQSRLAYWVNAYNAAVMKTVLAHYPIASVEDLRPPLPLFFLPEKSGFFFFQRVTFGGATTSLYALENSVIRKRFADPRIHFALNCASLGCPRLPRRAFSPERLDEQLDREARKFLAEERNLSVHHQRKVVRLSSIFDWYENDFVTWYRRQFPDRKATLLNYIALYVPADQAEDLRRAAAYDIEFMPYDWRLNDWQRRA
jgi:hypothetical protein